MAVATTNYGTFKIHIGTIVEVAGAMKGTNLKNGSTIFYNGTNMTGIEIR